MGLCTSRQRALNSGLDSHGSTPTSSSSSSSLSSSLSSYSIREKLGSGGFGTVYKVLHTPSGEELVAKKMETSRSGSAEIVHMADLRHPNIIQLLEYHITGRFTFLILEFLPGSMDLFDFIDIRGRLKENNARYITAQLCYALTYLHEERSLAHLDVKPENLLIAPSTGQVKLIDFGAAQRITSSPCTTFRGTRQYACPEILFSQHYDPISADIWAVGVTLHKMLFGFLPFKKTRDYLKPLNLVPGDGVGETCVRTLLTILHPNPSYRPASVREISRGPWITGSRPC
eukprot:sb/3467725/